MTALSAIPALSVVLPTYNAERYVADAVSSVLNQDFADFELLVIDDGSTDNTRAILQSLAIDSRLKLLRNESNMGLIATLHRAYGGCRAPLIARMDADDICEPSRFTRQISYLDANPQISILGGAIRFFGNVTPNAFHFPTEHEAIRVAMLFYCPLAHPALMFRRTLVDQGLLQYDDEFRHAEDYHLWSRLLLQVKAANLHEVVLNYRLHAQQVSSDSSAKQYAASLNVRRHMLSECRIFPTDEEVELHESVILERPLHVANYMAKLAAWFLKLESANAESRYWDSAALHELLCAKFSETAYRTGADFAVLAADRVAGNYVSGEDVIASQRRPVVSLLARYKRRGKALLRRLSTIVGKQ